jgi:hypothetical protein
MGLVCRLRSGVASILLRHGQVFCVGSGFSTTMVYIICGESLEVFTRLFTAVKQGEIF